MKKAERVEKAVEEIIAGLKNKFPRVRVRRVMAWLNADAAIEVETTEDNGWEISEFTAPLQIKFLEELDVDIRVLPLEKHDGQKAE